MSGCLCLNSWSWTIGGWWKDGRTKHSGFHEQSDETDEYNWTMEKSDFSALLVFKLPTELYTMLESWKHWQHFGNIKYQVFIPTVDRIFISSKWWWPYLIHWNLPASEEHHILHSILHLPFPFLCLSSYLMKPSTNCSPWLIYFLLISHVTTPKYANNQPLTFWGFGVVVPDVKWLPDAWVVIKTKYFSF